MIRDIRTAEALAALMHAGRGYLYNDFGGRVPGMCPVHAMGCRSIPRMLKPPSGRLGVPKIWSDDLDELITELQARGKVYAFCQNEPGLGESSGGTMRATLPGLQRESRPTPGAAIETYLAAPGRDKGFRVDREPGLVTVSSEYRLQYDRKPRTQLLKDAIAAAASGLEAGPWEMLEAIYFSTTTDAVDAENVLLYNVGTGRFAAAARNGLRFERVYSVLPGGGQGTHSHRYSIVPLVSESSYWRRVRRVVAADGIPIPPLNAFSKPDSVWIATRTGVPAGAHGHLSRFSLELELEVGSADPIRPADVIKPLVDGVVAGLHTHDGSDAQTVVARLADRIGLPPGRVEGLLGDPSCAWLGRRRLLWPRADGLQWNPGDDLCVSAVLRLRRSEAPEWRLSFSVHEVEAAA